MQFQQTIGQQLVKDQLRNMIQSGRLPHAQLFLGPTGCGKLSLALAFAQYLLCENRSEADSCGKCPACIKAAAMIHPDIHFSFPVVGTKMTSNNFLGNWRTAVGENPYVDINQWMQAIGAENKQGNLNKEECLNIIRKLSLKTFESTHKVLILWMPEYLGKEGNRLLKLIEEPPENTVFLLVAEDSERILNTILSRCQIVKINQLGDEELINGLIHHKGLNREQALQIAPLADGNFNEALKLLVEKSDDNAQLFLEWMRKCYKGNGVELVGWVDKFAKIGRENQKHFLRYALHFMREYLLLKMNVKDQVRLRPDELKTARNLIKVIEFEQIEALSALFNDCSFYVERNANPKILFLDASIRLHKILRSDKTARLKAATR
ncbi:MAG: hypothetical protein AAF990_10665 [Bacteroidota bacterium]